MKTMTEVRILLSPVTCCQCGMVFGLSDMVEETLRNSHNSFCCPAGHVQHFAGKSQLEKAKDQLEAKERDLKYQRECTERMRNKRDEADRKALAEKRVKMRYKNDRDRIKSRVGNGVCPCCNRTFQDLAKHMQGKHPEFRNE